MTADPYAHLRADHTVDVALFTIDEKAPAKRWPGAPTKELQALLVQRARPPFAGCWALPGGYMDPHETLAAAALRELGEETGLAGGIYLEQLRTYDAVDRDPRRRTLSTAYIGLVPPDRKAKVRAGDDAGSAAWFPVDELPGRLAFDHGQILSDALQRLRNKVDYTLLAFRLLPEEFTMSELRHVYEAIHDEDLGTYDERKKANFQRSIHLLNERVGRMMAQRTGTIQTPLVKTGGKRKGARGPAADLYRFVGDITLVTK